MAESAKGETTIAEPSRAEQTIARRVAEARATVPELELSEEAEVSACVALHEREGHAMTAILLRACALSLKEVPRANAAYRDGHFELYGRVNVGVVLSGHQGCVIATVTDADRKSLEALSGELRDLGERAGTGELTAPETSGATFTMLNAGASGSARTGMVSNPPQAAAIAAGAIRHTPVVRAGRVEPGLTIALTLVCDHRILYGAEAARFLSALKLRLEQPERL